MQMPGIEQKLRIQLFKAEDQERWSDFVNKSNESTCYHNIGWKNVIEKSFGHKTNYYLCEDQQKNITGILPIAHLKSILFGNFMVSLPYFTYGGICAMDSETSRRLLEQAIQLGKIENVEHIELRETRLLNNGLAVKSTKVSMRLVLPSGSDQLWKSFSSRLRNKIKRPEKEQMHVRIGKSEELESFYKVFSINMRDLGTPVYTKNFFKNILEEFPDSTWICTVYREKEPIASGMLVGFKDTVEIPWVSSRRHYNRYYPNFLLYWTALKFACDHGYKVFDFGRSSPGGGTYQFKGQWGAKPVQLYWHYWMENGGSLPELNPNNPKYRAAIQIWKRLPVGLTRMIGPAIVKNLP